MMMMMMMRTTTTTMVVVKNGDGFVVTTPLPQHVSIPIHVFFLMLHAMLPNRDQ